MVAERTQEPRGSKKRGGFMTNFSCHGLLQDFQLPFKLEHICFTLLFSHLFYVLETRSPGMECSGMILAHLALPAPLEETLITAAKIRQFSSYYRDCNNIEVTIWHFALSLTL